MSILKIGNNNISSPKFVTPSIGPKSSFLMTMMNARTKPMAKGYISAKIATPFSSSGP